MSYQYEMKTSVKYNKHKKG